MATIRILLPALILLAACEKKTKKAPVQNNQNQASTPKKQAPKKVLAPRGVPDRLEAMIQKHWTVVTSEGAKFNAKFQEAQKLRSNRAALTKKIEEARGHYTKLKDEWAKIAYWPVDQLDDGKIDQKTHDLCEKYLHPKSTIVKGWDKKAKSLKELSAVK